MAINFEVHVVYAWNCIAQVHRIYKRPLRASHYTLERTSRIMLDYLLFFYGFHSYSIHQERPWIEAQSNLFFFSQTVAVVGKIFLG